MVSTVDSYVSQFHHLQGTTLGERRRSFNYYFRDLTASLQAPEDIKTFFDNLKPLNRLEEVLHLVILLHYKQQKQLLDILYNEDSILIKLLLKDGSFVERMFKDSIDTEQFMEFMDKVSFVVRSKVITKLSKMPGCSSEHCKLDSYYFALKRKYGLDVAKNLLSGCSLQTITAELKQYKILFTNNQLTRIYERSNDFLEEYFGHLKSNNHTDHQTFVKIIKMIALTNEDLYWTLLNAHELQTTLSYKQTIVVFKKYKAEVIKKFDKYKPIFNKHAIIDSLTTEEFKIVLAHLIPESIDDFEVSGFYNNYNDCVFYLSKFATKQKRFEILQDVFVTKYNANILEHEECINELLLELIPVQDRVGIIEKKLQKGPQEDNYLAFYETNKAWKLLKQKISNTTDANKRMNYVDWLIKVCKVNNDMSRLPEVLDYILKRHKNEDNSFYSVIFRSIQENCSLPKFDQAMWNTINGLIEAFKLRFKTYEYTIQTFEEAYMLFKVKNNISIEEDVSKILKESYKDYSWYRFSGEGIMLRNCLDVLSVVIPKMFEGKKLSLAISMYYNTVNAYNRQHKNKRIDVFKYDFMVKYWEDLIEDQKSEKTCIFDDLTFVRSQPELLKKIIKLIWEGNRTDDYQWRWFLKHQPQDIVLHYEKYFEDKSDNRSDLRRFPYTVTYFSHLGIPELFYKKSCELLQTAGLPGKGHQYVAAVKFLVHHKQFIQIVEPFLPKDCSSTIDPNKDEKNFVGVRQAIARVIGNYKQKADSLDALAAIAKGDYLQFALFSMHKIMYHTPEYKLKHFLEQLAGGSVSLRKHVIFILAGISTVENVYGTLKKIGQTEENASIRTYLLKTTLQYFQLNPSKELFDLTKQHARLLDPINVEGYSLLIELQNIPMEFISLYVEFIWGFIMDSTEKDILELRFKLLGNINKTIMKQINDDLLQNIVLKCLDFEKDELQTVYAFVYQYIIDRDVKNVGNRISLVVKQFPEPTIDLQKGKACKNASQFIIGFCKEMITKKNDEQVAVDIKQIFTEFANLCGENVVSFKSSLWLNLTKIYINTKGHRMFMRELGYFYIKTVHNLGSFITHQFAETFSEFASTFIEAEKRKRQETLLDLLLLLLDNQSTGTVALLLVVSVLPKSVSKSETVFAKHLEIMNTLNKCKNDVVKTAISCYLESISYVKKIDL